MTETIYEAAGSDAAMLALARAWHERCLADPVASHPFSHGTHPQHVERLAAYWGEALGGPPAYTDRMGDEEYVQRLHAGQGEHHDLDERAIACFEAALDDADLPADPRLHATLVDWFRWSTDRLAGYPASPDDVPDDVTIVHWSWDGPVDA